MSRDAPTAEQQALIDGALDMISGSGKPGGAIKALAGAGAGKTSTLINAGLAIRDVYPNARILYLAYNREIKLEAERKFNGLADAFTINAFALRGLGSGARGRKLGTLRPDNIRRALGNHLSDTDIKAIRYALKAFTESAEIWPETKHIPDRIDGHVITPQRQTKTLALLEDLIMKIFPGSNETEHLLPHDVYLKAWQMTGSPGLDEYDIVMLDEAQDANPVILASLEGAGRSIYVGDSHQAIYQWRNAVDALQRVYGQAFPMTQSFRFGPVIADAANTILDQKHDKPEHKIRGFDQLKTDYGTVDRERKHTRIFRTNRALIQESLVLFDRNIPFAIAGNNEELSRTLESVYALSKGDMQRVRHPFVKSLRTWDRAVAMAEEEKGELAQAIKIVEQYDQRVPEILHILQNFNNENEAIAIMTTAHRSKGREWPNVIIAADFDEVIERSKSKRHLWDAEMNLLYVAVTRAMGTLDVRSVWLRKLLRLPDWM